MKRVLVSLSLLAFLNAALPAEASDLGQAYDQVTKFQPNADIAALEPGDFISDWQTASTPAQSEPPHGGMFGRIHEAMNQASGAMAMMHNGMAESHWVAGLKERTDFPAQQTGTITDCGARTITHLDLKAKTYYVVSMDQPQAPRAHEGGRPAPGPAPTDDGTKVSMTIVNTALGPKKVFGNDSNGFKSEITMVTTKADGESTTNKMNRKEYVSGASRLWLNCSAAHAEGNPGMMSALNRYNELARIMATRKDSRFTMSSTGPALPSTLAYFEALQFGMGGGGDGGDQGGRQGRGGNIAFMVERDHIRSIAVDDPIFAPPPDFKKVDAP